MIASFSASNWSLFLIEKCVDDAVFVDLVTSVMGTSENQARISSSALVPLWESVTNGRQAQWAVSIKHTQQRTADVS